MLDKKKNKIYSHRPIDETLITNISQSLTSDVIVTYDEGIKKKHLTYTTSLQEFNWKIGFRFTDQLFALRYKLDNYSFKQVIWPDYGQLPFHKEFIQISSILNHNFITYKELNEQTSFSTNTINQFLNAAYLSNHVILISNSKTNNSIKTNTTVFLKKLKSFFLKK